MFCKPIFSLVFLMSGCVGVSACLAWQGKVTHVSDGDTLWVQAALHRQPVKVRILGIDAPEICQAWGAQSRQALQAAILGRAVNVQGAHKDSFGRLLAKLRVHGDDVGAWMVLHGHAWSYTFKSRRGPYDIEQMQAQNARAGLFADPSAVPPRFFRKRFGSCPSPTHGAVGLSR